MRFTYRLYFLLYQGGFSSPVEAALERARWAKILEESRELRGSQGVHAAEQWRLQGLQAAGATRHAAPRQADSQAGRQAGAAPVGVRHSAVSAAVGTLAASQPASAVLAAPARVARATNETAAAFEEVAAWIRENGAPGELHGQLELKERLRRLGTELGAVRMEQSSFRGLWGAVLRELFPSKWTSRLALATHVGANDKSLRTWQERVLTLRQSLTGEAPKQESARKKHELAARLQARLSYITASLQSGGELPCPPSQ